jgi:hypothetical protein
MPNYEEMTLEQLRKERERAQALLTDARDERAFLGKQTSMHIKVSELNRLDRDIERFETRLTEIDQLIEKRKAAA